MELNMPQIVLTAMTIIAIYFAISSFNKGRKNLKYQKKIHFLDELYTIANNHKSYVGSGGEGDKELFLTINSMSFEELESISDHLEFYIYHFTLSCRHLRTFFEAQTKWIKDKKSGFT